MPSDPTDDGATATDRGSRKRAPRFWQSRGSPRGELPPLDLTPDSGRSPALLVFLGRLEAFRVRVHRRDSWVCGEVMLLLDAAARAAVTGAAMPGAPELAAAQAAFDEARAVHFRDAETRNRLVYVAGLLAGAAAVALLAVLVAAGAAALAPSSGPSGSGAPLLPLADLGVVAPLVGFAGAGAVASVLSRLTTLELRDETSKWMVLLSGAARPVLAVLLAAVVAVILRHGLIGIAGIDATRDAALVWVAAFLCGFSERFASDILERVPFGGR